MLRGMTFPEGTPVEYEGRNFYVRIGNWCPMCGTNEYTLTVARGSTGSNRSSVPEEELTIRTEA